MKWDKGIPAILPAWAQDRVTPGQVYQTPEDRMRLAIELSRLNVEHGKNGPFGAAVFERLTGRLISVGVNCVVRVDEFDKHAEFIALQAACKVLGCRTLSDEGVPPTELVSSTAPCCMCFGAIWWSGPSSLICGATGSDAEAIGFGEGPLPADWDDQLRNRRVIGLPPVDVVLEFMRSDASAVLQYYKDIGGEIYNAGGKAINQAAQ